MYILFMMYDDYNTGIISILLMFIPLFLVLVIFVVSFFFKEGHNHTMFNVASFLSLLAISCNNYKTPAPECQQNPVCLHALQPDTALV